MCVLPPAAGAGHLPELPVQAVQVRQQPEALRQETRHGQGLAHGLHQGEGKSEAS